MGRGTTRSGVVGDGAHHARLSRRVPVVGIGSWAGVVIVHCASSNRPLDIARMGISVGVVLGWTSTVTGWGRRGKVMKGTLAIFVIQDDLIALYAGGERL